MPTAISTRTYAVDPVYSEVSFSVRHLMIAQARGHFTGLRRPVTLGPGDVPPAVDAAIDATSVSTREESREAHLRLADLFDVAAFAQIGLAGL